MKTPPTRAELARQALSSLNACRGRGDVVSVRVFLDGTGEADRQGQYFSDTIRFRTETTKRGKLRVFALGSSRIADPNFT